MQVPDTIFLIDDDAIQLKVASKMIERTIPAKKINSFLDAKAALDFLETHANETTLLPDIILLDLNMPEINGWDFLEVFERKFSSFLNKIRIFILSSSQDENDIERSHGFPSVKGYLVKPLTREKINSLLED